MRGFRKTYNALLFLIVHVEAFCKPPFALQEVSHALNHVSPQQ